MFPPPTDIISDRLYLNKVCSEHHHFWLISLTELCQAETFLHNDVDESSFMDMLNFSIMHYMKGISALKVSICFTESL